MSANKRKFEQVKLYHLHIAAKYSEHGLTMNSIHGGRKLDSDWERLIEEGYLIRKRGQRTILNERHKSIWSHKNSPYANRVFRSRTSLHLTDKGRAYIKSHPFDIKKTPDLNSKYSCSTMHWYGRSDWCGILV